MILFFMNSVCQVIVKITFTKQTSYERLICRHGRPAELLCGSFRREALEDDRRLFEERDGGASEERWQPDRLDCESSRQWSARQEDVHPHPQYGFDAGMGRLHYVAARHLHAKVNRYLFNFAHSSGRHGSACGLHQWRRQV